MEMDTAMEGMNMDHSQMAMDPAEGACEKCEDHASEDLAFINSIAMSGLSLAPTIPVTIQDFATEDGYPLFLSKFHLANAGPPVVPKIVSTIVLRT